jgi:uncharacterized protein (TIGR02271 family)
MQNMPTMEQFTAAQGQPVYSSDGEKIGTVDEIFYDVETRQPEWIAVGKGFFKTKRVLVPVQGANIQGDGFYVAYSRDQVEGSPDITGDEISQETERDLYSYYGLGYSERESDTGLAEGGVDTMTTTETRDYVETSTAVDTGDTDVIRSEEELRVGKRQTEAGRVRLRKWVETVPVQEEVQVTRETARVERQPIDQPVSGAEMGEQEIEVPLQAEQAVVSKEAVAKERITVDKDVETATETVSDELRRERVEVEGDAVQPVDEDRT